MLTQRPTADASDRNDPAHLSHPGPDEMAERAAWALALAAWMNGEDADALAFQADDASAAMPDAQPADWWQVMPHASDWWM